MGVLPMEVLPMGVTAGAPVGAPTGSAKSDLSDFAKYEFILSDGWFVLELPRVAPFDADGPLQNMQDLAEKGGAIRLDIPALQFALIARYLTTGVAPPRASVPDAVWPRFVRACDYLGLGPLPAAVSADAEVAYLDALTFDDALVYLRERAVAAQHRALGAAGLSAAPLAPPHAQPDLPDALLRAASAPTVALAAVVGEKFRRPYECGCHQHRLTRDLAGLVEQARVGSTVRELEADFAADWVEQYRELGDLSPYRIPYVRVGGRAEISFAMGLSDFERMFFPDFPWARARSGSAHILAAGPELLRTLSVWPEGRWAQANFRRTYGAPRFDLFVVAGRPEDAMEVLCRMHRWVSGATSGRFMMARTAAAVEFHTRVAVYVLSREFFGTAEEVLCSMRAVPVAFDGARFLANERGERMLRLKTALADPTRHTPGLLKQLLARGLDVAVPGLGPRAAADLSRLRAGAAARYFAADLARTHVERLFALAHDLDKRSDYDGGLPAGRQTARLFDRPDGMRRLVETVHGQIQARRYAPVVYTRNLAYVMFTCEAGAAAALTDAADPDLAFVPPGAPASQLTFERGCAPLPGRALAARWFPDENVADARIKRR